jgi:eukaryotic-like serine/threonine-protein kinase
MNQQTETGMMASWKDLEGVTLPEKFQLQNLLFEEGASACFVTRITGGSQPTGWLWLVLADAAADGREFENWQIAAGLSHPNLLEARETGRTERGVTSMAYLLTEPADDTLAAVLRERPLDQLEAREVLLSAAKALSYLHARALVHGNVEPAAILAVGDKTKLTLDKIAPSAESGDGVLSVADDLRALGDCIHAMFTQSRDTDLEHLSAIPQPFRDIVRGCYGVRPNEQWTAQRVIATLDPPPVAPAPAPDHPSLEWVPAPPPASSRKRFPVWVLVPAAVAAAFLVILLARHPHSAPPPAAPPAAPPKIMQIPRPAPVPERAPAAAPSPLGPPVRQASPKATDLASSRIWRVVSYTYSKAEDATKMVREINRKWPHLRAEQFSINGGGPPYLVSLGGRMTRNEAVRLQQRAISSGLPPDTFVRNFRN